MANTFTIQDFFKRFPDNDTCLDHLMKVKYGDAMDCPKCGKRGKFHRIRKIPAYECAWCGHHIHPMKGTPFERSRTPLTKWFYAIYLFTTSYHGVPAKELQRQLGVTYKCAWRMGHEIRKYMGQTDGNPPLTGHVEVDETYIGGHRKGREQGFTGRVAKGKTIVFGILERGSDLYTKVIPNVSRKFLIPLIVENVPVGTKISSDEWPPYSILPKLCCDHNTVEHGSKQWAKGDTHVNSLEGFWSILKRSIRGTHIHVFPKHLSKSISGNQSTVTTCRRCRNLCLIGLFRVFSHQI